ncbi:hypothetical protein [Paraliomyxa miuraensis]|uniref:hypothetical protein n=1 Tax=Paraliomyxa miuraensis TaxID=376150 RepID=UPI0022581799|nr:hypothetical protein [Paraliomyxa miuraensis]MCX4239445.1 hypothetical protein [Paraliomyxa miuraensis]
MDFQALKIAVAKQFERMQRHALLRASVDKDALWTTYLDAFPPGTNEVFRERREYDCSCCRRFVRAVGDVVAIIDGKLETIWDVSAPGYEPVTDALAAFVRAAPIDDIFLHDERTAGVEKNFEEMSERVHTWHHFFVNIHSKHVKPKKEIPAALAEPRDRRNVLVRGLRELTDDAVETVLELIAQNSLYRGQEHEFAVTAFAKLKAQFAGLSAREQELFGWTSDVPASVAKIRNSAIGTLLIDLSEGRDLNSAVARFEALVAPANYKRPTALISKAMIEQAQAKLTELGLGSALQRRYATLEDITINNILFADRAARQVINGDVFDDLIAATASTPKGLDKIEEVSIERFLADILPRAQSLELLLENRHASKLVSLIAPIDPTAGRLFKWDNNFSWSYAGEFADSIRERVKKAGGNITGDLCCRLSWSNFDDLDLHMHEPGGGHIYFGSKHSNATNGRLDVDMNAGRGTTREPVENIFYGDRRKMREGTYTLSVNQYAARESTDIGFEVEIDCLGTLHCFAYAKPMRQGETVEVAKLDYRHESGFHLRESLPKSSASRELWGLPSESFHRVTTVMMSPNHWDEQGVGNRHYFFMLDGCKNDGSARGFFNEFLKSELDAHRKVFEVVGSKMKVPEADSQLSGLGFSSTQKNTLVCRVKGSFTRTIKVVF